MGYWIFVLLILVVGFLTGFSIGAFILPIGFALLLLGPVRHRRRVFRPILLAVVGFVVGYLLFVPLGCTATGSISTGLSTTGTSETVCTSILGPEFRTTGVGDPPTDLALAAGAIAALAAGLVTLGVLAFGDRRQGG